MIPALAGIHSIQHPAHPHPPALGGEALQVQALRQSLRLARGARQPRAAHAQQGQGRRHLLRVRPALPRAGGLQLPPEDPCCSLVRNAMDVSWSSSRVYRAVCTAQQVTRGGSGVGLVSGARAHDWAQGTGYTLMPLSLSSHSLISKGRREFYLPNPLCAQMSLWGVFLRPWCLWGA